MGMFFFLMPVYALYVSTGKRLEIKTQNVVMLLLSYVLFTGFPLDIWQQTNGWVSGFANYSFSAVILAIFVKQCADLFKEKIELKTRLSRMALYFFTSFVLQLFLENITVYVVAVCVLRFHSAVDVWQKTILERIGNSVGSNSWRYPDVQFKYIR